MARLAAAVCMCIGLVSCAPGVQHHTASGRAEVTVATSDVGAVKGALVSEMVNRGYSITRDSESLVVFERPVDNVLAAALLGSRYDSTPNARVSFALARIQSRVRVIADLAIVTNPGSAFERRTNMNANQDSLQILDLMRRAKNAAERRQA